MIRPTLEVADIIRAQGQSFIERSRSWMTWAHQDSPWRATNRTAASRCGSASAPSTRGSWMSSAAGSTPSSITLPSIAQSCE